MDPELNCSRLHHLWAQPHNLVHSLCHELPLTHINTRLFGEGVTFMTISPVNQLLHITLMFPRIFLSLETSLKVNTESFRWVSPCQSLPIIVTTDFFNTKTISGQLQRNLFLVRGGAANYILLP